jgi:peptidoglycan hydrolase FlgJ
MIERLGTPVQPAATDSRQPEKIQDAARQFEALLIGQMLKSMREAGDGALSWGGDQASSAATEYAQEMFAQALSKGGGLGLSRVVVQALQQQVKP